MKRSKNVLISRLRKAPLFGAKSLSVAVATVVAASCSSKEEAYIFKTVEECGASPKFSTSECQTAYQKSLEAARETAPRYTSLKDCEYEFGASRCEQYARSGSGSFFVPLMAGFMISEAFRRRNYGYGYNPLFSHYDGGYRSSRSPVWTTSDGARVGSGNKSKVNVSESTLKPKAKATRTMSRGGFGSSASAKSSWGGGSRRSWGG